MSKFILEHRPYQDDAMLYVDKYIARPVDKKKPGVLVAPTGSGKSVMIAKTIDLIPKDARIVVLQPTRELLIQNYKKYQTMGRFAAIYSAALNTKLVDRVTFATLGSVVNEKRLQSADFILIDECDGYPAEGMLSTFLEHSTSYQMIGYTATPWRLHGQRFAPATNVMLNRSHKSPFGMFIYFIQIKDIYEKYWAKLRYESYAIDDSGLKLKPTGLDYTEESMRNVIQPKQQDVAEYIDSMPRSYKKGVVFMPDVASAYEFLPKIKTKKCFVVHGKTPSDVRKNYLLGWMHGGYDLAINVGVLGIGVDFPRLDYLIGFRPTNSLRLLYQFYGRLTRPHPEKDHALIVDFAGNAPKFGRIEDIHFKWIDKSGWNLFIGHKRLTGNTENWGNINPDMPFEDMLISFGTKAKGKRISETDPGYLKWIAEEFTGKHNEVFVRNVKIYLERLKQPSKYGII